MSTKYFQKINNVRISIPRSEIENAQHVTLEHGTQIEIDASNLIGKTELSEDSESETERILFDQDVGKIIEINSKDGTDVITFECDDQLDELKQPDKVRPFSCDICHKMFTRVEILRRHLKTHMIEKEYKCTYCGKCFDRRDVLNDHMRNHTGEKPFQCTICHKKFTRGFVLLRHMRIHTDGSFKCKYCMKTFDRKDTFRDHMRNHTGEKPFKCRYCSKSFSRSFVLTKHEKGHSLKVEETIEEEDIHKAETILVDRLDYEDSDVSTATEILLQKEFAQIRDNEVIEEGELEEEIIEEDFNIMSSHMHSDTLVSEPVMEEVVETEAITLATADGQIVRVISREQYDKLLMAANKTKTYKCDTCNKTFTSQSTYQTHFNLSWENGGCISTK